MTAPLTDKELAEARALEQAATPGPWESAGPWPHVTVYVAQEGDADAICAVWNATNLGAPPPGEAQADAKFIAATRTLVPRLLATVDHLRAEADKVADHHAASVESYAQALARRDCDVDRLCCELKRMTTERDHLRAGLDYLVRSVDGYDHTKAFVEDIATERRGLDGTPKEHP